MGSARIKTPSYAHVSVFGAMNAGASVGWVPRDPLRAEAPVLAEAFPSAGAGGQAVFFTANQGATCSLFPGQDRAGTDFPVNSGPSLFTIVASCSRRNFKGSS